ncbi:hypothetical protein Drorol1_Dr00027409 [Drosera rotundifolia]
MTRTKRPSTIMTPPKQAAKRQKTMSEQPKETKPTKNKTMKTTSTKIEGKMMTQTMKKARTAEGKKVTKTTKMTTRETKDRKPRLLQTRSILDRLTLDPVGIGSGERNTFVPQTMEHISLIVGLPMVGVNVNVKDNLKSKTFE